MVCKVATPPGGRVGVTHLLRYSTLVESLSTNRARVITTPQGTGAPTNLCPACQRQALGSRSVHRQEGRLLAGLMCLQSIASMFR